MHDDIDAELERPLEVRAAECVVGDGKQAFPPGQVDDRFEIDDLEQRIGRRLDPQHARVGPDRCLDGSKVGEIGEADVQASRAAAHAVHQPVGAAIDVVGGDDMRAGVEQFQYVGDRREPRAEGEGGDPAFEVGHRALEGEARRVLAAGVFEPLVYAGALLAIGRRRVDRHHHRAGGRVVALAAVDRPRREG